jgi:hypothetical protein
MYHLYYKNKTKNVTGVTGMLRAFSPPRNTVKALPHLHYRHPVTAVTGICTRAHAGKNSLLLLSLNLIPLKYFPARGKHPVTLVTAVTTIDFK